MIAENGSREILVAKIKCCIAPQAKKEVLSVKQPRPEIWGFQTNQCGRE